MENLILSASIKFDKLNLAHDWNLHKLIIKKITISVHKEMSVRKIMLSTVGRCKEKQNMLFYHQIRGIIWIGIVPCSLIWMP